MNNPATKNLACATKNLVCDYLIVGAGASAMAFIDTLLTELPDSKVILCDKKAAPGGHWVDAYGFVRLHQPSVMYGVASKQLEGNWLKLMLWNGMLPWNHRAGKTEILSYFDKFVQEKIAAGQLEFFPNCTYNWDKKDNIDEEGLYSFSSLDGQNDYQVKVMVKFVDATEGECIVPSQTPLQFPVDKGIEVMTPNQVFDAASLNYKERGTVAKKKFVVLGAGKTGMDTVVYLQQNMQVNPKNIAWVISNDVWMSNRHGSGKPGGWPKALMEHDLDAEEAALALEKNGDYFRLDENIVPTRFRFPVVDANELALMRKVETIVRRGRAVALCLDGDRAMVKFADGKPAWEAHESADKVVFVHCTSPGPFNGKEDNNLFKSDGHLTLGSIVPPPKSLSMSFVAKLESARRQGTLDLDFGRQMLAVLEKIGSPECNLAEKYSENDILQAFFCGMHAKKGDNLLPLQPIFTLACFFALLDKDPMVAYNWQKGNRLTFLSIPGFKVQIYEDVKTLCSKGKQLGFSDEKVQVFNMLAEKLTQLEGM